MALEDYKTLVGIVATIVTIGQFLSGFDICRKIRQQGSTGEISGFPFVMGVFSASLWFAYGSRLMDASMMITNGTGLFLQFIYLIFYLQFCTTLPSLRTIRRQMGLFATILFFVYVYAKSIDLPYETITYHIGLVCCFSSIVFCAAPMISIAVVIRTKSTEVLPFPLIMCMFLVTGLWSLYGTIINNNIVKYQNMLGFCITGLQLMLFLIYPTKEKHVPYAPLMVA